MNSLRWQRFVNFALSITSILFSLFVIEGLLRIIKLPQLSANRYPCIYIEDEQLGYRYQPNVTGWEYSYFEIDNVVEINSIGFHDVEHDKNNDHGAPRIIAIGDSYTASLSVETSKIWTQILERELRGRPGIS